MDAEDTQKPKRLLALQATVAKSLKGINECQYKSECPFARQCPATC
ncbi:MAG TPA: hypothetical protein VET65_05405 [Candidatus Limnocylindrales bacterium]|nr:hypothetical protein [Candidatus Limnocylindrales bacterium]